MKTYFTIKELSGSRTAAERGIDNTPPPEAKVRLANLIHNILDPLRSAWGKPVTVNSGYRCPLLNKAVGGAATSQHMKGEAADITAGSKEANKRLFALAQELGLPFDQLILENGGAWVHVSHKSGGNRKQVLHLG